MFDARPVTGSPGMEPFDGGGERRPRRWCQGGGRLRWRERSRQGPAWAAAAGWRGFGRRCVGAPARGQCDHGAHHEGQRQRRASSDGEDVLEPSMSFNAYRPVPGYLPRGMGGCRHGTTTSRRISSGSPFEHDHRVQPGRPGRRPRDRVGDGAGAARRRLSRRRRAPGPAMLRDHRAALERSGRGTGRTSCVPGCSSPSADGRRRGRRRCTASCSGTSGRRPPWWSWRRCWIPPGGWRSKPRRCVP